MTFTIIQLTCKIDLFRHLVYFWQLFKTELSEINSEVKKPINRYKPEKIRKKRKTDNDSVFLKLWTWFFQQNDSRCLLDYISKFRWIWAIFSFTVVSLAMFQKIANCPKNFDTNFLLQSRVKHSKIRNFFRKNFYLSHL